MEFSTPQPPGNAQRKNAPSGKYLGRLAYGIPIGWGSVDILNRKNRTVARAVARWGDIIRGRPSDGPITRRSEKTLST